MIVLFERTLVSYVLKNVVLRSINIFVMRLKIKTIKKNLTWTNMLLYPSMGGGVSR